jgi:uncharacterized membrane protein
LLAVPGYAATIHGTVYDLSLEPMDSFVEINSVPKQFYVAVNGTYEFNINPGNYLLKVNSTDGSTIESIDIVDDGDYIIDVVIGLDIDEPIVFDDDTTVTDISTGINDSSHNNSSNLSPNSSILSLTLGIIIIAILAVIVIILLISRSRTSKKFINKNIPDDTDISGLAERVLALIREHSRITQKELRKMMPYSEAKISLIVAELEHDGRIRKIKKGRGNILVYIK